MGGTLRVGQSLRITGVAIAAHQLSTFQSRGQVLQPKADSNTSRLWQAVDLDDPRPREARKRQASGR